MFNQVYGFKNKNLKVFECRFGKISDSDIIKFIKQKEKEGLKLKNRLLINNLEWHNVRLIFE